MNIDKLREEFHIFYLEASKRITGNSLMLDMYDFWINKLEEQEAGYKETEQFYYNRGFLDAQKLHKEELEEIAKELDKSIDFRSNYDGNKLQTACEFHHIGAQDWTEILRFEDGIDKGRSDAASLVRSHIK